MRYTHVLPRAFQWAVLLTPDECRDTVNKLMAQQFDSTIGDRIFHHEGTSFAVTVRPPYPPNAKRPDAPQVWCLWMSAASYDALRGDFPLAPRAVRTDSLTAF